MPWGGREVPHAVIEVNQSCNIECLACYKHKTGYQKPLDQIKREIDLVAARRNLSAITIAGGEPTMYPELTKVVEYIAGKGLSPAMLTNATLLNPQRLQAYRRAGLERLFLHIDKRQCGRPDAASTTSEVELNDLRDRYARMSAAQGIDVALAMTLYRDALDEFPQILGFAHAHPSIDRILITDYSQMLNAKENPDDGLSIDNRQVYDMMATSEAAWPAYYLPSSHDPRKFQWLFYLAGITVDDFGTVTKHYLHPAGKLGLLLLPRLTRVVSGTFRIEPRLSERQARAALLIYALLSVSPTVLRNVNRLLRKGSKNGNLRLFALIFQQSPRKLSDTAYEICRDCPDATVRNGEMVPVCLADRIDSLETRKPFLQ
jgi:molybdenum cofactor biosynthesis enzyme MoaA